MKNLLAENMLRFGTKNLFNQGSSRLLTEQVTIKDPEIKTKVVPYLRKRLEADGRKPGDGMYGAIATKQAMYYFDNSGVDPGLRNECTVQMLRAFPITYTGDTKLGDVPMITFIPPNDDFGYYHLVHAGQSDYVSPELLNQVYGANLKGKNDISQGDSGKMGIDAIVAQNANIGKGVSKTGLPDWMFAQHLELRTDLAAQVAKIKANSNWPTLRQALIDSGAGACTAIAYYVGE